MPYLRGRINYADVFNNKAPSVLSLGEKGAWFHQHTANEHPLGCVRPAVGELWT